LTCPYSRPGGHINQGHPGHIQSSGNPPHDHWNNHGGGEIGSHHGGLGSGNPQIELPEHPTPNGEGHTHPVGCQYCGCGIPGHGVINQVPQSPNTEKGPNINGANNGESPKPTVIPATPPPAPIVEPNPVEEVEEDDSWLDEEESEKPNTKRSAPKETEEDEEPPFDEAEEPLSENMATTIPESGKSIGKTYKLRKVFFDYDNAAIKEESKEELNVLYSYLDKNPDLCVRLNAHTDSDGSNDYNLNLSQKRAQSVMDFLVSKGIDPIRLSAQGFGEELPISSNDTPEGREQNRRVEFTQIGC
jgi:outer membrane protein OmpA-like peptidoglycan-associated protein